MMTFAQTKSHVKTAPYRVRYADFETEQPLLVWILDDVDSVHSDDAVAFQSTDNPQRRWFLVRAMCVEAKAGHYLVTMWDTGAQARFVWTALTFPTDPCKETLSGRMVETCKTSPWPLNAVRRT